MPSPFPGMDPYLEAYWGDVHSRLVLYASDLLQGKLPRDLVSRVEERVFVESPDGGTASVYYPDVRVVEHPSRAGETAVAVVEETIAANPLVIDLRREPITETFIEIRDRRTGNRLVTVIEVLSPSNKRPGVGRKVYLRKQRELQRGRVNLVEIDLLRDGRRTFESRKNPLPLPERPTYMAAVWRASHERQLEVYPIDLRRRLPVIRVPLRADDADVILDLQAIVDQAYRNGRYELDIDYSRDIPPPLEPADAFWAHELLREKGLR